MKRSDTKFSFPWRRSSRGKRGGWQTFLRCSATFLVLMGVAGFTPSQSLPMFRGGLAHSGVYAGKGAPQLSRVLWAFHADGQLIASPAVHGDTIYIASTAGTLYSVDRATGKQKWSAALKTRLTATPAVADGLIYFPAFDGKFYAVDAQTGKTRWTFTTGGEHRFTAKHLHGLQPAAEAMPDPWDCWLSSPAVWKDVVYFGSGDGNVYALDTATGALKWKFKTGNVVHASPAIADGMAFIGSWDSYFYALDAATGALKWKFKTGEDPVNHNQQGIQSSAAVVDGVVYFGCRDAHLYALDERTGEKKWAYSTKGSWVLNSPAVSGGKVYFATSDTGLLYVADAKSGAIQEAISFNGWPVYSSPAIASGVLYVGSTDGTMEAINLDAGRITANYTTEASRQNMPGIKSYFAPFTSDFYDDLVAGYNKILTLGPFLASPVVVDDAVYAASVDGNLYALQ